jgi:chromosome segregation ATPase
VLDFKIQELNGQIEPLHSEITTQREQIRRMNEELSANHKKFTDLTYEIGALRAKATALVKENAHNRRLAAAHETTLERYRSDLRKVVACIQDPPELKEAVKVLWAQFTATDSEDTADMNEEVQAEMARQRDHLERAMSSLRGKAAKEREAFAKENRRLIRENVALIAEINALRRDSKELRATLKDRESSMPVIGRTARMATGASAPPATGSASLASSAET